MLYTSESGTAGQPAIVFLHGGGLSSKMWQPVIERLAEFHCLAPDLPEHGQSRAKGPFDLEDAARQVAEIIRQRVPGGRAHLVGLSLGGAVTLTAARLAPEVLERTMVSGTAAGLSKFLGQISLLSLGMLRLYSPQALVKASIKQFGIPPAYQADFQDDLLHTNSEAFNRTLIDNLMRMQLPASIEQPLLVTVGETETIPAKQAARKLLGLYPQATGRMVPGLGHVWALQNPALFAETVRAWVCGKDLPAELRPL